MRRSPLTRCVGDDLVGKEAIDHSVCIRSKARPGAQLRRSGAGILPGQASLPALGRTPVCRMHRGPQSVQRPVQEATRVAHGVYGRFGKSTLQHSCLPDARRLAPQYR